MNDSEEQAEADLEAIHSLEDLGMFDYSIMCPSPPVIGSVVVVLFFCDNSISDLIRKCDLFCFQVDPFSTGANLAASVIKWGYKLIFVFSEHESTCASIVTVFIILSIS